MANVCGVDVQTAAEKDLLLHPVPRSRPNTRELLPDGFLSDGKCHL